MMQTEENSESAPDKTTEETNVTDATATKDGDVMEEVHDKRTQEQRKLFNEAQIKYNSAAGNKPYSSNEYVPPTDPRLEGINIDKLLGKEPLSAVSNEARKEYEALPKDPRRIAYFYDETINTMEAFVPGLPSHQRFKLTYELLKAYGMMDNICMQVLQPKTLAPQYMTKYHSDKYVYHLRELCLHPENPSIVPAHLQKRFNFNNPSSEDTIVKPGTLEACTLVCGASIEAARLITKGRADVAINWMGGMQLAKRDESCGGNFINDSVLVCLELLEKFDRILYVSFSYHHCEAVEEAFYTSNRIVTLSMHSEKMASGDVRDNGHGQGKKFHLNLPMARGVTDEIYFKSFESTMEEIRKVYEPQVVVCVVDPSVLGGDIHGDFNLTSRGLVKCMKVLKDLVFNRNKVPCLLLGGTHGSFSSEAAKLWAYCTSVFMIDAKPKTSEKKVDGDNAQTKEEQQKEELAKQGEPWEIKLPFDEIPEHEHSVYYYDKSVHTTLRQLDDTNLVHDVYEKVQLLINYQHVVRRPGGIRRRQFSHQDQMNRKKKRKKMDRED